MSGLEVTMMKRIGELNEEVKLLKAENERLTKAHSDALGDFWAIHKGYFDLKAEVERLRASSFVTAVPYEHYERVIKAGDAMASCIQFNEEMEQDYEGPTIVRQCVKDWNAAKEGRPNE